jgi:hypothetical protein
LTKKKNKKNKKLYHQRKKERNRMVKTQNKDQKSISQNLPPKAVGPKKLAAWKKPKRK